MQYFSALIKPASSLCNMRCAYCFYHDVARNRQVPSHGVMPLSTAEALVRRVAEFLTPPAKATFLFQGGEPTLAGLAFFEQFTALCDQYLPKGVEASYSLQTNGLCLDGNWCRFLKERRFLTGLSWDGPAEIHDRNRLDAAGKGTFARVKKAAELLERHGAAFNVLCVVTKAAARHPEQLVSFFLKQNIRQLQFIPCLEPLGKSGGHGYTLSPRQYGAFLTRVFDLWAKEVQAGRELHVRAIDNLLLLLQGRPAEQCGSMGFCTAQFVVEADGSVYPCDFYVLDEFCCGNVLTHSVQEIQAAPALRAFLERTQEKPAACESCPVKGLCGGGCKRYRPFFGEEAGYCPQQEFYVHALDTLRPGWKMPGNSQR